MASSPKSLLPNLVPDVIKQLLIKGPIGLYAANVKRTGRVLSGASYGVHLVDVRHPDDDLLVKVIEFKITERLGGPLRINANAKMLLLEVEGMITGVSIEGFNCASAATNTEIVADLEVLVVQLILEQKTLEASHK